MSAAAAGPDFLVVGHSLVASVAATRLVADGYSVVWVGRAPAATVALDGFVWPAGPTVAPSPERMPGLMRALREVGVDRSSIGDWAPVRLQLLGDGRRDDVRDEAWAKVESFLDRIDAAIAEPPRLERWRRGATTARVRSALAWTSSLTGTAAEVASSIDRILSDRSQGSLDAVRVVSGPHALEGGLPTIVSLLSERFDALGGRRIDDAVAPQGLRAGFRGVRARLASGTEIVARAALVGDESVVAAGRDAPGTALLRWSCVVATQGLPMALGPVSIIDGRYLLERHRLSPGIDGLNLFWRDTGTGRGWQEDEAFARLKTLLPFFEGHLKGRLEVDRVPGCDRALDRDPRPSWRVLRASGPMAGHGGWDGAARLGLAVASRAKGFAAARPQRPSAGSA